MYPLLGDAHHSQPIITDLITQTAVAFAHIRKASSAERSSHGQGSPEIAIEESDSQCIPRLITSSFYPDDDPAALRIT